MAGSLVHSYEGPPIFPLAGAEMILFPTIVNTGSTAANVTLELDVPYAGAFERSFTADAICSDGGFTVSCTLPTLAPGAEVTPDLLVRMPATTGNTKFVVAVRAGSLGRVDTLSSSFYIMPREASLSLQLMPSPLASVAAGGTLVETMRVKNSGIHYTTPVTIMASTDSTLTPLGVTGPGCHVTPIVCSNIVLGPGESIDITTTLRASNTSALATFTGSVTSFTTSPLEADASIIIGGDVASTVTTLTADRDSANAGQPVTYTAHVTNAGPGDAFGVKTRIVLSGDGRISAADGTEPTNCAIQQQPYIVECDTPTLARGTTSVGTVSVVAPTAGSAVTLTATTTSFNGASQTVSISTPVDSAQKDVAVSVLEGAQSVTAGQRSTLHFNVTNAGGVDAANVFFDATFGAGLALASIETTAGSCAGTHCAIGTLKAGATQQVTLTVAGVSLGARRIDGAVSCDAENGPLENNRASVTINVAAARSRSVRH